MVVTLNFLLTRFKIKLFYIKEALHSPIDSLKSLHGLRALHRLRLLHELWLLQVLFGRQGALAEGALEEVPGPLQGVLDLVGEVLEGADGDALLWGILG